jgi:hypothetical protein
VPEGPAKTVYTVAFMRSKFIMINEITLEKTQRRRQFAIIRIVLVLGRFA